MGRTTSERGRAIVRRFNVRQRGDWYEVECPELGILITAKSLESAREIAVKAARSRGIGGVVLVESARPNSLRYKR